MHLQKIVKGKNLLPELKVSYCRKKIKYFLLSCGKRSFPIASAVATINFSEIRILDGRGLADVPGEKENTAAEAPKQKKLATSTKEKKTHC